MGLVIKLSEQVLELRRKNQEGISKEDMDSGLYVIEASLRAISDDLSEVEEIFQQMKNITK